MKASTGLLLGIFLGVAIGWFLGYTRLPEIGESPAFFIGFIACGLLLLLALVLMIAWNKHSSLLRLSGKSSHSGESKTTVSTYRVIWIAVAAFILGGGLISSFLIYKQNKFLKTQVQHYDRKLLEQSELIESVRKGNLVFMMGDILDQVDSEQKQTGTLSDAVIARIAALSLSLKPYRNLDGDSLTAKEVSPERGQLLMALVLMKIDSASFMKVKQRTTFAGADLAGAGLEGADLSMADLQGANMKGADLDHSNLSGAGLKDAILWGADLSAANLSGADLKRSDLRRAKLIDANLKQASFDGAQMMNAQLMKVDARSVSIQWANLEGAFLNDGDFTKANLTGTGMEKANLSNANFTRTDLRSIRMDAANLTGVELSKALVDSNWNSKINTWQLTGLKEVKNGFSVVSDTVDQWKHPAYRLRKNEGSGLLPLK